MKQITAVVEGLNDYYKKLTDKEGQFILHKRLIEGGIIKSIKQADANIYFVRKGKKQLVVNATVSLRMTTDTEYIKAESMLISLLTSSIISFTHSDEFKELL